MIQMGNLEFIYSNFSRNCVWDCTIKGYTNKHLEIVRNKPTCSLGCKVFVGISVVFTEHYLRLLGGGVCLRGS